MSFTAESLQAAFRRDKHFRFLCNIRDFQNDSRILFFGQLLGA